MRTQTVNYLQDLINIGVTGFRFDAGKHMEPRDIDAIINRLSGKPYMFLEITGTGPEAVTYRNYNLDLSDVTEFKYSNLIGNTFANGFLSSLQNFGEGMMSPLSAVVFTDNHDN